MLGVLHVRLGEREKAIEYYGNAIKAGTQDVVLYTNQAAQHRGLGMYDKALELCENYIEKFGDSAAIRRYMASVCRDKGDHVQALQQADKAFFLSGDTWRNIRAKGDIYLYMDEWDKAEQEYQKLLEKQESNAYGYGLGRMQSLCLIKGRFNDYKEIGQEALELSEKIFQPSWVVSCHMWLAYGERRLGRWDQALKELDSAWQIAVDEEYLPTQRNILFMRSQIYLEMDLMEEAQETAAELKQRVDQTPNKNMAHLHHYVTGMIELKKENFQEAFQWIQKARSLLGATNGLNLLYTHSLGKAYYLAGDMEKAAQEFKKAIALTTGKLSYGDVYAGTHFMLGRVYQKMGQTEKAVRNYQKFLEFWKDADPGLSEVQEARVQLQKLKSI